MEQQIDVKTNSLTEGSIPKTLLKFFFPILLGTLFQQLYNTVDAIIVGRFVGPQALASVGGSAAVIVNLVIGFFVGLASGAMIVVSQYYGAGEYQKLRRTVGTGVFFCLVAGAALSVAGIVFAPQMLRLAKEPEDIIGESVKYLRIYFSGTIPVMLFNIGSGILRAVGDSRRPLYYLTVACVLNIVLDLLFVAVFDMGVSGAGWATVIALTVSAGLTVFNLATSQAPYRIRSIRPDGESLKRILRFGIPAGMQSAMYSASNLLIQTAVNNLGSTVVAAWSTTGKLDGIFWNVSNSFATSISAFCGQAFGAGKYDRMKKGVRVCLLMSLGSAAVLITLLLTLGRYGFRIFTDDRLVIDYAVEMLWYFVPFYGVWVFIDILSSALRGAGDTVVPTVITVTGICGLRVLWCLFVVPRYNTVAGISYSYPFSWSVTALTFVIYWLFGGWLKRCIAKRDTAPLEADAQ